jgi:hypothetical protein
VAPAWPGSGNRQTMFSVLLHFVGSPVSLLTPLFRGPRHCGQFSARADVANAASIIRTRASESCICLAIGTLVEWQLEKWKNAAGKQRNHGNSTVTS